MATMQVMYVCSRGRMQAELLNSVISLNILKSENRLFNQKGINLKYPTKQ